MRVYLVAGLGFLLSAIAVVWADGNAATAPATHPERQSGASSAPTATTSAGAPIVKSRPASGPSGRIHGDFKGTAQEFLEEAMKDPDVGVMNPPADKDPYGSLGARERMERLTRSAAELHLHADATVAEFNQRLRDRQRDAKWAGMGPCATGYHRGWYPDGNVMFIEHFTENGLVWARYYDAGGKLLSKVDDGNGLALLMQTWRRPGLVRGELPYANGQPANADGRFDESKYQTAMTRDSVPRPNPLAMSWQQAMGWARHALGEARHQPTSAALPQPPVAWNAEGIGTIWQDGQRACGLRVKDETMFLSDDGGATKRELKSDANFPPRAIHIIQDGSVYLLGVGTTAHPDKGIPNQIVFSRDMGKTWAKTSAPVDYVFSLDVQDDGTIVVTGSILPAGGLREGEHWCLLQPWAVMTTRGARWTRTPHPFMGPAEVVRRIHVGDKGGMAYVVQQPSGHGPGSYQVLLCRGLDQMPILAGRSGDEPEVVVSGDGQSLQVLAKGQLISNTDIRTGKVTPDQR